MTENIPPEPQPAPASSSFVNPLRLLLFAFIAGISVDVLFYNKTLGISFPIFIILCAAILIIALFVERANIAWSSLWLLLPMIFFSLWVFLRAEPLTTFVNVMITFALGALLIRTIYHGQLFHFGLFDHFANFVLLGIEICFRPFPFLWDVGKQTGDKESGRRLWLPIIRGLIIAVPLLCLFAILLSAADLVFADSMRNVLTWLNLGNIPELIARGILILMATFIAIGLLVQAVRPFNKYHLIGAEKPMVPTLLGMIESSIVLGGINLMFGAFVVIQFRYLFGSTETIVSAGYTFSEYARRGFGELVLVVMITLGILLALSTLVKRDDQKSVVTFNALNFLLVAFVGVMVISALQRLLLYENIFGFSRLRTYSHVAIIWLGILFVPYIVALLAGRMRWFATGALFVVMGFGATLNLLNVDQFIARQNINRSGKLHGNYLITLSDDAMPEMIDVLLKSKDTEAVNVVGAGLACRLNVATEQYKNFNWQSTHITRQNAYELLKDNSGKLLSWTVDKQNSVMLNGKRTPCRALLESFILDPGLTSEYR